MVLAESPDLGVSNGGQEEGRACEDAAGYIFRRLLVWLAALWRVLLIAMLADPSDVYLAPLGHAQP